MDQPLVLPVFAGDKIHSQICISCHRGRQSCLYFVVRIHFTGVCGNPKHLLCYGTSVWIFDTSSHKHVIFFSSNSFAPMLCLTVLPFVQLDADKWIATLLPRQDVGNVRGERKYINGGHGKSNVYSSL